MRAAVRLRSLLLMMATAVPLFALAGGSGTPADKRRSGFEFMGKSTQAMQRDDTLNPGMLWVKDGEALWNSKAGRNNQSCASCHGNAESMRGVATRYPSFDAGLGRPIGLAQRIGQCRQKNQGAEPWRPESEELLSLESYVAHQSRGMPVAMSPDPRLKPHREKGEQLYRQRIGQLNLSCAQCHDDNAGRRLGSAVIPEAHPTGYPIYRLEWQGMGSLQRRLRNCMTGVRAQAYPFDAVEMTELELYLAARASGMPLETPGVRP